MNVVIIGTGAQGAPAAAILARHPEVRQIVIGSRSAAAGRSIVDRSGLSKLKSVPIDANQPAEAVRNIRSTLDKVDVVIDLTPSFASLGAMQIALGFGAHYVNTAAHPRHLEQIIKRQPLELSDAFRDAGKTAVVGCGASPGIVNILCRYYADRLDRLDRLEIRTGFPVPAQHQPIKTWMPTWSPDQQYFDFCDPPCLYAEGAHQFMPVFSDFEIYDFGAPLGTVEITQHSHDETYSLPILLGKGLQYCCFKYPFEPAVAAFHAAGFTHDRMVEIDGRSIRAVDVLMKLMPKPVDIALLDVETQRGLLPIFSAATAHIRMTGSRHGEPIDWTIRTGAYYDESARALDLFGSAGVGVPYAAATAALLLADGTTPPGVRFPEELDPKAYMAKSDQLGLTLHHDLIRGT